MATTPDDDIERVMRDADAANGEPDALDREPEAGELPSDHDVQAERQPDDGDTDGDTEGDSGTR